MHHHEHDPIKWSVQELNGLFLPIRTTGKRVPASEFPAKSGWGCVETASEPWLQLLCQTGFLWKQMSMPQGLLCSHGCGECVLFILTGKRIRSASHSLRTNNSKHLLSCPRARWKWYTQDWAQQGQWTQCLCAHSSYHSPINWSFSSPYGCVTVSYNHWWRNKTWAWFSGQFIMWEQVKKKKNRMQLHDKVILKYSNVKKSSQWVELQRPGLVTHFMQKEKWTVANGLASW